LGLGWRFEQLRGVRNPVLLERSYGFARKEINRILKLVQERQQQLLESWHEFFHG
jgi:hypothetical protein